MTQKPKNTGKPNHKNSAKKNPFSRKEVAQSKVDKNLKDPNAPIRLNKYIANSGVCSRRDADIYIQSGNVTVNGKVVTEMGYKVKPTDNVIFDGRSINPEPKTYVLLNKPKGFYVSGNKEKSSRSVADLVSNATTVRLSPVGKLETSVMGLLLLTNDGTLAQKIANSKNGIRQIYQLELDKPLSREDLDLIKEGPFIEGKKVIIEDISYVEHKPLNVVGIELRSQRSHIVQRIFKKFGYEIQTMDRVVFANLDKKNLPRGNFRNLTKQEIINLGMF